MISKATNSQTLFMLLVSLFLEIGGVIMLRADTEGLGDMLLMVFVYPLAYGIRIVALIYSALSAYRKIDVRFSLINTAIAFILTVFGRRLTLVYLVPLVR